MLTPQAIHKTDRIMRFSLPKAALLLSLLSNLNPFMPGVL